MLRYAELISEMTLEEKASLMSGANFWNTKSIDRLKIPSMMLTDDPHGLRKQGGKADHLGLNQSLPATCFPTAAALANSWDMDLLHEVGACLGKEAAAEDVSVLLGPVLNIKRNPLCGRNFEYFSEDPLLSGKMSAAMVRGAQSRNVIVFMKHFALNDQETNARSGIFVWANEQAIRELYLRPFEITVKEAEVTGVMSSFVHMGYKWCGGNPELLRGVLRDEWGFVGVVSTDAVLGSFMDLNKAIRSGNDLMLDVVPTFNGRYFDKLYQQDPVGVTNGIRACTHNICYALLQTNLFR